MQEPDHRMQNNTKKPMDHNFNTRCVHAGTILNEGDTGTNTPVYPSTSYSYLERDETVYPRYFNAPNTQALNRKIAALEGTGSGLVFSSGMAAISSTLFAFLRKGDHVVFQKGMYGGTFTLVTRQLEGFGIEFTITKDNNPASFEKAIRPDTRMIYIETPSNPLLAITDIAAIAGIGKKKGLVTVIDNTFASPVNQNPAGLGIDIVLHSATKYLGGHHDICAGAAAASEEFIGVITNMARSLGGSLNPLDCYLLERSLKTLSVRVKEQNANALELAGWLANHAAIRKVHFPGLKDHPDHELARSQMKGFGGMLSFELKDMDALAFQKKLELIRPSVSLGGVDTIISSPVMTSHRHLSEGECKEQGISAGLLRLSVGIEDVEDLKKDIDRALNRK